MARDPSPAPSARDDPMNPVPESLDIRRELERELDNILRTTDSGPECLRESLTKPHDNPLYFKAGLILGYLQRFEPDRFVSATKTLADKSRDELWRLPLGDFGVLGFYLELVADTEDSPPWLIDALRLIGNACIDLHPNRRRLIDKIDVELLLKRLENTQQQADLVIGVLYNLCMDFEPGQEAVTTRGLFKRILEMFRGGYYPNTNVFGRLCNLLEFAIGDLDAGACPEDAVGVLYRAIVAAKPNVEDSISLCTTITKLLTNERLQKLTIARSEVGLVTTLFVFSYTHDITTLRNPDFTTALQFDQHIQKPEDEEALCELRSILSARLWDISALPEFAFPDTLTTDLLCMLRRWLSRPQTQMQLCACSVFRNLTLSDAAIANLIRETSIDDALVDIFTNSSDAQVLVEALRLYGNLIMHPDYRILLGGNGAMVAITALWSKFPVSMVQAAAANVIRQLLAGENFNVKQFLAVKPDPSRNSASGDTYVARLMNLYSSTQDLVVRMEVGRIVVAMWRMGVYRAKQTEAGPIEIDDALFQSKAAGSNIACPVMAMITDSKNPSLVTEGWLGLALIAGTKEGSVAVVDVLCISDNLDILRQTVAREDEDGGPTKDGNNANVLLRSLKKNHPNLPNSIFVTWNVGMSIQSSMRRAQQLSANDDYEREVQPEAS